MKIRSGFVSNSSTASFVIFGIKGKYTNNETSYEDLQELLDEAGLEILEQEFGETFLGKMISFISSEDYDGNESEETSLSDLNKAQDKIEELKNEISKYFESDFSIGIHSGITSC